MKSRIVLHRRGVVVDERIELGVVYNHPRGSGRFERLKRGVRGLRDTADDTAVVGFVDSGLPHASAPEAHRVGPW